jgi:hypothetical protein
LEKWSSGRALKNFWKNRAKLRMAIIAFRGKIVEKLPTKQATLCLCEIDDLL